MDTTPGTTTIGSPPSTGETGMDKPRVRSLSPGQREALRLVGGLGAITLVVMAVGLLPVLFVWIGMQRDAREAQADVEAARLRGLESERFAVEPPPPPSRTVGTSERRDVLLESRGATLAASVALPAARYAPPHPAVVVVHGSGRARRSHYRWLVEQLNRNGYAALTYDKRGVGSSTGEYSGVGAANSWQMFDVLADDALAGVDHLLGLDEIDRRRVGLLGISQGGWISPLAATRSRDVSFVVVVSGPAVSVGEEIYYSELTGEREGVDLEHSDAELSELLAGFEGPHGFDPVPFLARVDVPTLWLLGKLDRSLPIPETVTHLRRLEERGRPLELHLFPGVGHGMRSLDSGERMPYLLWVYDFLDRL